MSAEIPDRPVRWLAGVCVVLLVAEFLIDRHPHVPGEGLPWFYSIVGFVAFTLIVLGAKSLRTLIRRPEDFYGSRAIDDEPYPWRGLGVREAGRPATGPDDDGHEGLVEPVSPDPSATSAAPAAAPAAPAAPEADRT